MPNNSSRLLMILLIVACVFHPFARIAAQNASSGEPQAAKPATFRVAGTVVSSVDGRPLARAEVFLIDTKNPKIRQWMITSDDGHFEFNQVAKGKYSLEGGKRGFIRQAYNQHEEYSTAIVTGADVPTEDLVLRLTPTAIISVKILDESGEPVRKASVMLYREDRSSGVRRIQGVGSSSTDDLGSCEFTRLNAGTYFLGVTATPWYAMHPASVPANGPDRSSSNEVHSFDVVYPPTYFGDTSEADSAAPIVIKGGDQEQAEIRLSPVQSLHLVFAAAEDKQHGVSMPRLERLGFEGTELPQMGETQNVSPGLYEITIAPGRYKVTLPGSTPAEIDLATNGQDLSQVRGEALSTVKATVRIFGEAKLPQPFYVQLRPVDGSTAVGQTVDEKGEVTFANVNPGQYNIFGGTNNKGYAVVKVSSQGSETPGHSLNVPPGSSLTTSISLVGGLVNVEGYAKRAGKAAPGAMVVLVPDHPESNRELFRRDQSDLDGSFNLQGIAPGSYGVIAIEDGWNLDWALPTVIGPYLKGAKTVTITAQHGQSMQLPEPIEVQRHH
jgi:protocatechuate 3,4-dioxygenase beta subunit